MHPLKSRISDKCNLVRYCGLALYWAWVYLSFNSDAAVGKRTVPDDWVFLIHLVSCGTAAAVLLFIAASARVMRLPKVAKNVARVSVFLMTAGTAMYSLPVFDSSLEVVLLGSSVSGAGASVVVVTIGESCVRLPQRTLLRAVLSCFLVASIIYFCVSLLPGTFSGAVLVLLSFACSMCAARIAWPLSGEVEGGSSKNGESDSGKMKAKRLPPCNPFEKTMFSKGFIVGLVTLMFAYGGLKSYLALSSGLSYANNVVYFLASSFAVLALYAESKLHRTGDIKSGYRVVLPLMVVALAFSSFLGHERILVASAVSSFSSVVIEVTAWIMLVEACAKSSASSLLMFALGRSMVHVGMFAGELCGMAMVDQFSIFALTCICAIVIVASFMFADRTSASLEGGPNGEANTIAAFGGVRKDWLMDVGSIHGLSPRESEVFVLWATGHGSRYIEEKLCIAPATVKTHVRHIYGKFGVKTKAELMRALDEQRW